ncbi:MAG: protein kinase [Pirellulaceae bacterium]
MPSDDRCPQCDAPLSRDAPQGLCPACLMAGGLASSPLSASATEDSPATRFRPPKPADLAPFFPQLELLDLIGHGGMGAVYKARQKGLDRVVALKILPPEVGRDDRFAERFTREAKALARLNHPHIVTVHDVGKAGDYYFFVMEYVEGLNLREAMQAGRLTPQEAMAIVPQVCDALQYAHDEGIVHRDIKPENILIDKKGRVKIADFGLAKLLGRKVDDLSLTQDRQVMGTPRYMAPEQFLGSADVDHRADIYSLGVVFYEMLTGELPMGRFAPPSRKVQVDVRLDDIVLRALDAEPQRRYQQASEVKTGVETIASSPKDVAPPPVPPARSSAVWVPLMLVIVCVMLCAGPALLGLAGLLWYATMQQPQQAQIVDVPPLLPEHGDGAEPVETPPMAPTETPRPAPSAAPLSKPLMKPLDDPRPLQFRVVPDIGDDGEEPILSQQEFDKLVEQLRKEGPEVLGRGRGWGWFEAGPNVTGDDLPIGVYEGDRYLLACDGDGDFVSTVPQQVATVIDQGRRSIAFQLDEEAGTQLRWLTSGNLDKKLAVVVGRRVVSAPIIRGEIGSEGQITGNFTAREVVEMVDQLSQPTAKSVERGKPVAGVSFLGAAGMLCILPTLVLGAVALLLLALRGRRARPHPSVS